MSCSANNTCRTVARVSGSSKPTVECALKEAKVEQRLQNKFQKAVKSFQKSRTVNIDYANEYLTRSRESDLGTLAFFIVDDLLDTLNLDATRVIFGNESSFSISKVKNADTIKLMYHLAEDVKLLDTVAEKTLNWFGRAQKGGMSEIAMDEHVWNIWETMNLSEYIRMYKEMYECMPGEESRSFYESTSLQRILEHCNPERTAKVIEYTVSNAEPTPICANVGNSGCQRSKRISNSSLRKAAQETAKRRSMSLSCARTMR